MPSTTFSHSPNSSNGSVVGRNEKERMMNKIKSRLELYKKNLEYYFYHATEYFTVIDCEPIISYLDLLIYYSLFKKNNTAKEFTTITNWFNRLNSKEMEHPKIGELIYILFKLKHLSIETLKFNDEEPDELFKYHEMMYT